MSVYLQRCQPRGMCTFVSTNRQDILIGLLRLRKPSPVAFRPEIVPGEASIVRELHVYGSAVPVHDRDPTKFQHQVERDGMRGE